MRARVSLLLEKILRDPEGRKQLSRALLCKKRPARFKWRGKIYVLKPMGFEEK